GAPVGRVRSSGLPRRLHDHALPPEVDVLDVARRRVRPGEKALAPQPARNALGGGDGSGVEGAVLLALELVQVALLVEAEGQRAGLQTALLRRVLGSGPHREVGVGRRYRLLQ